MSPSTSLKDQIQADVKSAMKAGQKDRLATLRLIMAAIKQVEVDSRKQLEDEELLAILDKMSKQRRESMEQFQKAQREDLFEKEKAELAIISEFMPAQLEESEIISLIEKALLQTSAQSMKDMGAVMGILKPQLQGRADMSAVSKLIKAKLSS